MLQTANVWWHIYEVHVPSQNRSVWACSSLARDSLSNSPALQNIHMCKVLSSDTVYYKFILTDMCSWQHCSIATWSHWWLHLSILLLDWEGSWGLRQSTCCCLVVQYVLIFLLANFPNIPSVFMFLSANHSTPFSTDLGLLWMYHSSRYIYLTSMCSILEMQSLLSRMHISRMSNQLQLQQVRHMALKKQLKRLKAPNCCCCKG